MEVTVNRVCEMKFNTIDGNRIYNIFILEKIMIKSNIIEGMVKLCSSINYN